MRDLEGRQLGYNLNMGRKRKGKALLLLVFPFLVSALFGQEALSPQGDPLAFLSEMKQAFEVSDRSAYIRSFAPEIREQEGLVFDSLRDTFRMTSVMFRPVGGLTPGDDGETLFVNAVFRNDQESMLETWKLHLVREGDRRVIRSKSIAGNPAIHYTLSFPSERSVRA
ncbi:MAG: hypothetical protein JW843_06765, partial [Candidatus Aminicenantes bacterium]|nr:hypothetical protein [Candidatus Aminicenantes bacterium]